MKKTNKWLGLKIFAGALVALTPLSALVACNVVNNKYKLTVKTPLAIQMVKDATTGKYSHDAEANVHEVKLIDSTVQDDKLAEIPWDKYIIKAVNDQQQALLTSLGIIIKNFNPEDSTSKTGFNWSAKTDIEKPTVSKFSIQVVDRNDPNNVLINSIDININFLYDPHMRNISSITTGVEGTEDKSDWHNKEAFSTESIALLNDDGTEITEGVTYSITGGDGVELTAEKKLHIKASEWFNGKTEEEAKELSQEVVISALYNSKTYSINVVVIAAVAQQFNVNINTEDGFAFVGTPANPIEGKDYEVAVKYNGTVSEGHQAIIESIRIGTKIEPLDPATDYSINYVDNVFNIKINGNKITDDVHIIGDVATITYTFTATAPTGITLTPHNQAKPAYHEALQVDINWGNIKPRALEVKTAKSGDRDIQDSIAFNDADAPSYFTIAAGIIEGNVEVELQDKLPDVYIVDGLDVKTIGVRQIDGKWNLNKSWESSTLQLLKKGVEINYDHLAVSAAKTEKCAFEPSADDSHKIKVVDDYPPFADDDHAKAWTQEITLTFYDANNNVIAEIDNIEMRSYEVCYITGPEFFEISYYIDLPFYASQDFNMQLNFCDKDWKLKSWKDATSISFSVKTRDGTDIPQKHLTWNSNSGVFTFQKNIISELWKDDYNHKALDYGRCTFTITTLYHNNNYTFSVDFDFMHIN